MTKEIVLLPGEGEALWFRNHLISFKAVGQDTGGAYTPFELTVAPAPSVGAPPHVHGNEDEGFYVLEGELEILLEDRMVHATAGSYVYSPKGQLHGFVNPGTTPGKVVVLLSPSGLEKYFQELSRPAESLTLPPPPSSPPDVEHMIAVARKYNIDF